MEKSIKFASIDIGSNAMRLLFCRVIKDKKNRHTFSKEALFRMPLRLGEDAFSLGFITDKNIVKLQKTLSAFKLLVDAYDPIIYRSCATAALRNADNGHSIIEKINESMNLNIEIISGEEEAKIIMSNHIEKHLDQSKNYVYIDVGGGSTEISFITKLKKIKSKSFPIGSVRLLKNTITDNDWSKMKEWIINNKKDIENEIIGIGSGGNINKIFSLSQKKKGEAISINTIYNIIEKIKPLSFENRMTKMGMRPDRADVIDHAGSIYLFIMKYLRIEKMIVPESGLPDGIVRELYKNYLDTN